jgi:hypothetical protein
VNLGHFIGTSRALQGLQKLIVRGNSWHSIPKNDYMGPAKGHLLVFFLLKHLATFKGRENESNLGIPISQK